MGFNSGFKGLINPLNLSGYYMYHQVQQPQIPCSANKIYLFCMDLRTNSDYFPIQH